MRQSVRLVRAHDGVTLAWAAVGNGPALVKTANWLTHLEHDRDSPLWRQLIRFFGVHFRFIRYDERGCGMSDADVADVSVARWIEDLETVIGAAAPVEPFLLLGISQGAAAAIEFTARYPERVSRLILYGAYSRGWARRPDREGRERYEAILKLTRLGWGQANPIFRQLFTARFVPGATHEQIEWFNELCRKTTSPQMAARLMEARGQIDVYDVLARVHVPTLVLHARHDEAVPFEEARTLTAAIPGAKLVEFESRNHILLEDEPAWERFKDEVLAFAGMGLSSAAPFAALSARERQILMQIAEGHGNAAIGRRLFISEKTVRNHITHIFEKLGVRSRAQAIVLAKNRGIV